MSSGQELNNIVRNVLNPLGFVENDDYCWLSEQLTVGHDSSYYDIIHKDEKAIANKAQELAYEKILEIIPSYKYLTLLNKRLNDPFPKNRTALN